MDGEVFDVEAEEDCVGAGGMYISRLCSVFLLLSFTPPPDPPTPGNPGVLGGYC